MRFRPRTAALLALCAAAALVAGCGGGAPPGAAPTPVPTDPRVGLPYNGVERLSAEEILAKARQAAAGATSLRMWGVLPDDEGNVDLRFNGDDARGTLQLGGSGERIALLRLGDAVYLKAAASYWRRAVPDRRAATYRALAKKWVRAPENRFALFGSLAAVNSLIGTPKGPWEKGQPRRLYGPQEVPAIPLRDDAGLELAVSTAGPPYPVAFYFPGWSGGLEFADWNKPVRIDRPAPGELLEGVPAR
jgi:hypothetical protein